ncbi:Glutathione S-transferase [Ectocarpus siliculosus]|uniref:Glutathione S-transferase n=1 Tax=Ectocarpus siliculosus TaxID=2880 RepID=D7FR33_ECTSI|nr:Glutathione S-transferase [Ectocarpus siliculosus]|eukprot:CBJ26100.1 Glutathione S-transferase [Ectocarpus siliculosus]
MAPMKLTYFEFAALGEPLRLALAQSGVEWIDNRLPSEEWPTLKPSESAEVVLFSRYSWRLSILSE